VLLAACDGGGGSSAPTQLEPAERTLQGTAAIGAAIANGQVNLLCATGPGLQATTKTDGNWQVTLGDHTFPCSVRVSGGNAIVSLHSHVTDLAQTNITPITDLILAYATGLTPTEWFSNRSAVSQEDLDKATDDVLKAFRTAGYNVPDGSPYTTPFKIGDEWDTLLDTLGESMETSDAYEALLTQFAAGNLDALPGPNDDEDPEAPSEVKILIEYAGTYNVANGAEHTRGTIIIGQDGSVDFDEGVSFKPSQINAIYDRRMVEHDRRVQVNYDANDSGEVISVYLDSSNIVTEILYRYRTEGISRQVPVTRAH